MTETKLNIKQKLIDNKEKMKEFHEKFYKAIEGILATKDATYNLIDNIDKFVKEDNEPNFVEVGKYIMLQKMNSAFNDIFKKE